jgi:hypothetical protein
MQILGMTREAFFTPSRADLSLYNKASFLRPIFPSLEEQRRLVTYLDGLQAQVTQLRAHQEETQKELDALMPSILDKAFNGELRW